MLNADHSVTEMILDFLRFPETTQVLRAHMDPKLLGTEVRKILGVHPPEIQNPGTPGESLGTKFFV